MALLAQLCQVDPLLAQSPPQASERGSRTAALLWTRPSQADRVIWGQWSWHINNEKRPSISNDAIIGVVYRGFFAGTFTTTHEGRAYAVGIERDWASFERSGFGLMLGYRFGLVYGYDEELGWLAEAVPILPFTSPMLQARLGPVTAELTHTWVVLSLTAGVRF